MIDWLIDDSTSHDLMQIMHILMIKNLFMFIFVFIIYYLYLPVYRS
jgi:hypothetical protein